MSDLIAKPNGFAAHEAIRRIREATETLHAFFGLDPEDGVAFHIAAPDAGWYRQDNYVQFIDTHLLCEANSPDALLGRWTVLEEQARGDLVHLRLETDSWEIHYIVYASAEIRDPDALEQIKRLERWPEDAPKKNEAGPFTLEGFTIEGRKLTHEQIRNDLALCQYAWWHMYFASLESVARIYDALDKQWFKHENSLYVRHYNDSILCWMRLNIKQEHRKGGIVYFHSAHPDSRHEFCALHSEALEVHDPSEQEAARKEAD